MTKRINKIDEFFLGDWYPVFTFALILVGYFTKTEVFTILINALVTSFAIIKTGKIKPLLFTLLTFVYQFHPSHTPLVPPNTMLQDIQADYYLSGYPLWLVLISVAILVVAVLVVVIRDGAFFCVYWREVPMLVPVIIFSITMLTNGLLHQGSNDLGDFLWGLGMAFVYCAVYLLCYLGLRNESREEMIQYFIHLSMLMSWILVLQVGELYVSGKMIVNGEIIRDHMVLGFGTSTIVGPHAAMLVPANIFGLMRGRRPYLSAASAVLILAVTMVSTSRNAMLMGAFYFALCLVICFAVSNKKREILKGFAIASPLVIAIIAVGVWYIFEKRGGLNNNGRYPLWETAFNKFLEYPIFGEGFYSSEIGYSGTFGQIGFDPIPYFAHNTIFELLGATGLVGLIGYLIYRVSTIFVTFNKASLDRFMVMLSASVIIAASLLDNYVFQLYSPLYYVVATAITAALYDKDMRWFRIRQVNKPHIKKLKINSNT